MAGPYRRIQISKGEEKEKEERREMKNTRIRGTLSVHTHSVPEGHFHTCTLPILLTNFILTFKTAAGVIHQSSAGLAVCTLNPT
jgi:hypothetical protein